MATEAQIRRIFDQHGVSYGQHRDGSFEDPDTRIARLAASGRSLAEIEQSVSGIAEHGQPWQPGRGTLWNYPGEGGGGTQQPQLDPQQQARDRRLEMRSAMRATLGWLPDDLLNVYIDEWVRHGDGELAWGVVRTSPTYQQHFPGITRDDGTLRISEQEYLAHRDAFRRSFTQWGLNPDLFEGHHVDLIEGDVSIQEFRQRMDAKVSGVIQNLPQVRQQYGRFYGVDGMDDRALVAAALDPDVGTEILQGRITSAQVGAEAAARGFDRGRERAEHLVFAGGLDQQGARQLFSQAQQAVPQMQRFAERFRHGDGFGLDQFEDAAVFGDTEQRRTMQRLEASERAQFTAGGRVRQDQQGVLRGLQRR